MENVIILGSGCAGLTAAIYTARANLNPIVIEGNLPGGQLTTTSEVENFPGFPEGVDGYELMQRLRNQALRFGTRIINDIITKVEISPEIKRLSSATHSFEAKALIVATGASPKLLNVPGEKAMYGGKGVTTCATCDGAFYRGMEVVVIGGGDSACEEALFLTRFCTKVTLIHRRHELRASRIMSERVTTHPKIVMCWDSVVEEIFPDASGIVRGVRVKNITNNAVSEISCKGVFLAVGHMPNTGFLKGIVPLDDQGYVIPETNSMVKTKVPGLFAAGDCVDHYFRQAITAAGMGCQSAIETERWLAHHEQ